MEEKLADALGKAADALHWFGQYRVANALVLFSRLARARSLTTLDELEAFVAEAELGADERRETSR